MLKLYDYYRSSACFRVRIALNLKGLEFDTIPVHLLQHGGEQFTPEYREVNPQCVVPSMLEGNKILTQSLAIIEYLDEVHPSFPLFPFEPYEKALVRAFALSIVADIHPLNNLRVLKFLSKEFNLNEEQKTKWYQHWIATGFAALEKQLLNYDLYGDYCFGNKPTIADICLIPQMYNARRYGVDLHAFPTLVKIDEHCQQNPDFIRAMPVETVA